MPEDPVLELSFSSREELEATFERDLSHGRLLLPHQPEPELPLFARCTLRLIPPHAESPLELSCEVVMVARDGPMAGTAVQLLGARETWLEALRSFVRNRVHPVSPEPRKGDDPGAARRALTVRERLQIARGNVLESRVQLERSYGSTVWEPLLRNPGITVPEVARIARKASLPRPLVDLIAANEQWIRHALVRRALLTNPRLSLEGCQRILRQLPKRELKLVPDQTAYPQAVRQAARRLLAG